MESSSAETPAATGRGWRSQILESQPVRSGRPKRAIGGTSNNFRTVQLASQALILVVLGLAAALVAGSASGQFDCRGPSMARAGSGLSSPASVSLHSSHFVLVVMIGRLGPLNRTWM